MSIELTFNGQNELLTSESMTNYDENGERMSSLCFITRQSRLCGKTIPTLTIGGVGTEPQYRRRGTVRQMLERLFAMAPERGWAVSLLHPFSFSYYRKFGYEKVADHKVLEFPIAKLDCFERCSDLVPVNSPARAADCVEVYNRFSEQRNIMFPRAGGDPYPAAGHDGASTYLWYDAAGRPASCITLAVDKYYSVNRMISVNLQVYEMSFTTTESLRALFGFMRMFEGENDTVKLHNCAMSPEIDLMLRHYMHTSYTLLPDLAARVLDVPAVLDVCRYPDEHGYFSLEIADTLSYTAGCYGVEFQNGRAEITRLPDGSSCDALLPMPAFSQILYGYEDVTPALLPYLEGVKLHKRDSDLFRVFHRQPCGLYEHF